MKEKIAYGLIILAALVIASAAIAASPSVSVVPAEKIVAPGESFTIEILGDPSGAEVYSGQFSLLYNPAVLEATLVEQGKFLSQDGATTMVVAKTIDNTNGKIEYGETRLGAPNGVTTAGALAKVTFKVKGKPGDKSALELKNVILANPAGDEIPGIIINNGLVKIPTGPEVIIVKPKEGEFISSDTVEVLYNESGDLTKVSHPHLQLDGSPEVKDLDNDGVYDFVNVAEGGHTIQIWLVDMDHNKLAGAYGIVNFTVQIPNFPKVKVIPEETLVNIGENFTVKINVDPDTAEVYGAQAEVFFDTSILEATLIEQGTFLGQDGATTIVTVKKIDNTLGKVEYGETRVGVPKGVTIPGNLTKITFRVKEGAAQGAVTTLELKNVILSDPNAQLIENVATYDGAVKIIENQNPVAEFTYDPGPDKLLDVDEEIPFDASESYDPDGNITKYIWDFGDGNFGYDVKVTHAYTKSGDYQVTLTVADDKGATSSTTQTIEVELIGDVNHDGIVNIFDAVLIGKNWGDKEG